MDYHGPHSNVDPRKAVEHLRADPGLPIDDPLPSLWQQPPTKPIARHQSQKFPQETDVVIIGSGITGCSLARHLLQKDNKVKVTMLEARTITSGATGRNGGHIMVIPEMFYAGMVEAYGKDAAKEFVQFSIDNQDALLNLTDTIPPSLRASSELRQLEVLHVFSSDRARSNAQALVTLLNNEYGEIQRKCKLVSEEEMLEKYGIENSFGGATMLAGAAWPYRLVTGILTKLWQEHANRFFIEAETPAQSISWSDETQKYSIQTPRGTITAKNVVHATNAHAGHLLPSIRGFIHPLRCQVSVQEKTPESKNYGSENTFCITRQGALHSIYQSPQTGDIFVSGLVGISDFFEEFIPREDKNDDAVVAALSTIMNTTFGTPVQGQVKANWAGIMAYTADGLPLVGRLGQDMSGRAGTGEYIAAGYNGVGMVLAWLCGEHIADNILGSHHPRKVPSIFGVSKERVDSASLDTVLKRSYGTWE